MGNIIDFEAIRKEKEEQLLTLTLEHASQLQNYINKNVNIREMVKAKHIFNAKVERNRSVPFSSLEDLLFQDWLKHDYLTIRGTTIYQEFIHQFSKANGIHPLQQVLHALFMASVLEPFKVIKFEEHHIYAEKILTGEQAFIYVTSPLEITTNKIVFFRSIPIFTQLLCISDLFAVDEEKMNKFFLDFHKSQDSWRTFLKKNAIKYVWSCL